MSLGTHLLDLQRRLDLRHMLLDIPLQRLLVNGVPHTSRHLVRWCLCSGFVAVYGLRLPLLVVVAVAAGCRCFNWPCFSTSLNTQGLGGDCRKTQL